MSDAEWAPGDMLGLQIPAHGEALRAGGAAFLTEAFRASGYIGQDNRVSRVTRHQQFLGGGTGSKLLLSVEYGKPAPGLHSDLFVKFSRNFDDVIRDRSRHLMESEVRFAALSRHPGFPITVPDCLFADYHRGSGTGLLITQRVAFGAGATERHYGKCLDHEMPEPLEHYESVIKALARLAGTHKSGRLPASYYAQFPFDAQQSMATDRIRYTERQLLNRVARIGDFAAKYPQLLPHNIRSRAFVSRLAEDVPRFAAHEPAIRQFLLGKPEFIALCHWNANVDNAWFWRNGRGELECGLLDWGGVAQMSVAKSIYGAFSGADTGLWDEHLDDMVALFAAGYRQCGGPALDVQELKLHVRLFTAMMGLAYLMDAPAIIEARIPDLSSIESPIDPRFESNEDARVQLHMMTMLLNQWETRDVGGFIDRIACRA